MPSIHEPTLIAVLLNSKTSIKSTITDAYNTPEITESNVHASTTIPETTVPFSPRAREVISSLSKLHPLKSTPTSIEPCFPSVSFTLEAKGYGGSFG